MMAAADNCAEKVEAANDIGYTEIGNRKAAKEKMHMVQAIDCTYVCVRALCAFGCVWLKANYKRFKSVYAYFLFCYKNNTAFVQEYFFASYWVPFLGTWILTSWLLHPKILDSKSQNFNTWHSYLLLPYPVYCTLGWRREGSVSKTLQLKTQISTARPTCQQCWPHPCASRARAPIQRNAPGRIDAHTNQFMVALQHVQQVTRKTPRNACQGSYSTFHRGCRIPIKPAPDCLLSFFHCCATNFNNGCCPHHMSNTCLCAFFIADSRASDYCNLSFSNGLYTLELMSGPRKSENHRIFFFSLRLLWILSIHSQNSGCLLNSFHSAAAEVFVPEIYTIGVVPSCCASHSLKIAAFSTAVSLL